MNTTKWIIGLVAIGVVTYFLLMKLDPDKQNTPTKTQSENKVQVQKRYDEAGKLMSDAEIVNGLYQGVAHNYYKNGNVHSVIYYELGKKVGVSTWFYESGKPYRETPYKQGKVDGIQKKYYENGDLMAEIPYSQNILQPGTKEYSKTGRLIETPLSVKIDIIKDANHKPGTLIKVGGADLEKIIDYTAYFINNNEKTWLTAEKTKNSILFRFPVSIKQNTQTEVTIWLTTKTRMRNKLVIEKKVSVKVK